MIFLYLKFCQIFKSFIKWFKINCAGLQCEGIYRISGVKSKVQMLKEAYNDGVPAYLYEHEPNVVASLLKQFLRELPEPVLTTALMPKFEEASSKLHFYGVLFIMCFIHISIFIFVVLMTSLKCLFSHHCNGNLYRTLSRIFFSFSTDKLSTGFFCFELFWLEWW